MKSYTPLSRINKAYSERTSKESSRKEAELSKIAAMDSGAVNDYCEGEYGFYFEWNDIDKSCEVYSNDSGDFVGFYQGLEFNYTDDLCRSDGQEGDNSIPDDIFDYVVACARNFHDKEKEYNRLKLFEDLHGSKILCCDNDDRSITISLYEGDGGYVLTENISEDELRAFRYGDGDGDAIDIFVSRISDAYDINSEDFALSEKDLEYKKKLYEESEKYGFGKISLHDRNTGEYFRIERVDGTNSLEYCHYDRNLKKLLDHDTFNCDTSFKTAVDAIWDECFMTGKPDFEKIPLESVKPVTHEKELSWEELSKNFEGWTAYAVSDSFDEIRKTVVEVNPELDDFSHKREVVTRLLEDNIDDYGLNNVRNSMNEKITDWRDTDKVIEGIGYEALSQAELNDLQSSIMETRWSIFDKLGEDIVKGEVSLDDVQKSFAEYLKNNDFYKELVEDGIVQAPREYFESDREYEEYFKLHADMVMISDDDKKLLKAIEKEAKSVPDFFEEKEVDFLSKESLKTYCAVKNNFTRIFDNNAPFIFGEHLDKFAYRDYCDTDLMASGLSEKELDSDLGKMLSTEGSYFEVEKWDFQCALANLIYNDKVFGWKKELENIIVPNSSVIATRGLNYTTYRTSLKDNNLIFRMGRPLEGEKNDESYILTEIRSSDGNRKVSYEQLREEPNGIIVKVHNYQLDYNMLPELKNIVQNSVENDINKLKKTHELKDTLNAMYACIEQKKPYDLSCLKNDFSHVCSDFNLKSKDAVDSVSAFNFIYKKLPADFKDSVKKILEEKGVSGKDGDKKFRAFLDGMNPTIEKKNRTKDKGREGR